MAFNYAKSRATANRLIRKFGSRAILRRETGDRDCYCTFIDSRPRSSPGQLTNPVGRTVLMSAVGLTVSPDHEQDRLVTLVFGSTVEDEVLKIIAPPKKIAPAGDMVYWELQVQL